MKLKVVVSSCLVSVMILTGCKATDGGSEVFREDHSQQEVEKVEEVNVELPNESRLSTVEKFVDASYTGENMVVSPLSMDFALGMVNEGANIESLNEYISGMYPDGYNHYNDLGVLRVANSVWASDKLELFDSYKTSVKSKYGADCDSIDFTSPGAEEVINNWIAGVTQGKIENLIADLVPDTQTVLVNAMHFKDSWSDEFAECPEMQFTNLDGSKGDTQMLYSSEGTGYLENDYATGFVKKYNNSEIRFVGILPKEEGEFFMEDLDLVTLLGSLNSSYVTKVYMPEFIVESSQSIRPSMEEIGLGDVFKIMDFENMSNTPLSVSDVIQGCTIQVDKYGTEASAATAVLMTCGLAVQEEEPEIKEVVLDRPFAFLLWDEATNDVLFAGKVVKL